MAVPVYTLAYHQWLYNQNNERVKEQKKQHAYYVGNSDKIKKYLEKALEITYAPEDIEEMQFNWVNITKKVIDQMAIVYQNPADRYFTPIKDTSTEEVTTIGEVISTTELPEEELTNYYWSILPDKVGVIDKKAHRYGKLSNVSITLVLIDKEKKKIKYIVEPIYKYNLVFDDEDPTKIITLSYPKYYKDVNGEDELFTVVWTAKEHYLLDSFGNKVAVKDNNKMINPYGEITAAVLNFENGESWFGEGQNDLINVNEQLNVLLTKLVSNDVIYGSEGTDLAINLDLSNKGQVGSDGLRKIRRGRKHPLVVEQSMGDTRQASFQHVTPTVMIAEIREFIDWYIKYIASLKGLNPSAILAQLKDTSDYQKIMDSVSQMEMRKDDLDFLRAYEYERYRLTKLVWNTHAAELGMQMLEDDGFEFKVDLAEIEIHKTPADEQSEFEFELKYNLTNPIDYLINKNPDLTEAQAQEIINENKKINTDFNRQPSRLESLLNRNTVVSPTQEGIQ